MRKPHYQRAFEKDVKKAKKRNKDLSKLKDVITDLINEKELPPKFRNHKLQGNFTGYFECHVEPDWLLIYKVDKNNIFFVRTGTHSDLF